MGSPLSFISNLALLLFSSVMAKLQLSTLLVLSLMLTSVYSNEAAQRETNQIESRVGLFDIIASAFTTNGLDTAPYNVLRTAEGYEERLYPAQKWVKTQVNDISKDAATSPMFQKLFAFISGQNDKGVQVPMTSPVTTYIQPGAGPNCESTFTMAFYIEERPEIRVFARTYGGFSNDAKEKEEYANLLAALTEDDKNQIEPTNTYYTAGYDPPFKLFFRRNEIWVVTKNPSQPTTL